MPKLSIGIGIPQRKPLKIDKFEEQTISRDGCSRVTTEKLSVKGKINPHIEGQIGL